MRARWPEVGEVDHTPLKEWQYLIDVTHEFRIRLKKMVEIQEVRFYIIIIQYSVTHDIIVVLSPREYVHLFCHLLSLAKVATVVSS